MAEATYREIRDAAQAVNLCNAQQDVIRDLWAAVKASQALVGYAQSHLCLVGEDDVAREIAEEWAALIDKVFVLIATQMPGQWRAEFIPRSESLARCEETGSLKTACTATLKRVELQDYSDCEVSWDSWRSFRGLGRQRSPAVAW